ncbi:Dihydroorotate dehydrogenase (quinone), mitochondrial [Entophlyctis sp. JEL0112]|nr:Dihydroorotate dehydrogenase (quinone), mitochondrial [Entophlyctis sp. JEL0112]
MFARRLVSTRAATVSAPVRRVATWTALGVGVVCAAAYTGLVLSDTRAVAHRLVTIPLMHLLDPETAHALSIKTAKYGLAPREYSAPENADSENVLAVKVWNLPFENPIGLAAGCDKHAEAVDAMLNFGFGLVEIGSVTPVPQPGNPKPRMFRLEKDLAVINRYGFNSDGHAVVAARLLDRLRHWKYTHGLANDDSKLLPADIPLSLHKGKALGVNLGKNKVSPADDNSDYVKGVLSLGKFADYIVINISSPNTPGLRSLQRREPMLKLMNEVRQARDSEVAHRPAILVKIAPDVTREELEDIAAVVTEAKIDGNDVVGQVGGLSGPPVFPLALDKVRDFYALTNGKIPIIGCGGVSSAKEALAFGKAGASLVQLYTALAFHGPGLVHDIKVDLIQLLKSENKTWQEIVGIDHRK